jgi:hypothetical protein
VQETQIVSLAIDQKPWNWVVAFIQLSPTQSTVQQYHPISITEMNSCTNIKIGATDSYSVSFSKPQKSRSIKSMFL